MNEFELIKGANSLSSGAEMPEAQSKVGNFASNSEYDVNESFKYGDRHALDEVTCVHPLENYLKNVS